MVQFGAAEHIKTVAAGQGADCVQAADPWCVSWPSEAGFLFVRPKSLAKYPLTLAVVTDQHTYSLEFDPLALGSSKAAVHRLTFTYAPAKPPGEEKVEAGEAVSPAEFLLSRRLAAQPVPVNADYTIALGARSEDLAPLLVFDDGRFTYLKWPGNREVPAVFEVRSDASENVVNTRMQGDLIVVDRVVRALVLRMGKAVASIRNESFDAQGIAPVQGTTASGVVRTEKGQP